MSTNSLPAIFRNVSNADSSVDVVLITSLNSLLAAVHLPITVESPLDLIPSLLLAILESILQQRLPITSAVRESRSPADKVQAMKVFLGVLETDVLEMDVGLSEVDPRNLAAGEWDEVVFAGELLCWLGKQRGLLPPETVETLRDVEDSSVIPRLRGRRAGAQSPSTRSTVTNSAHTDLSIHAASVQSDTTVTDASNSFSFAPDDTASFDSTITHGPRCIHELASVSMTLPNDASGMSFGDLTNQSESFCNCHETSISSAGKTSPVRYTGWIDRIDDTEELQTFEASRRMQNQPSLSQSRSRKNPHDNSFFNPSDPSTSRTAPSRVVTRHTSPSQHKLALLNERAKLLTELAALNRANRTS
ncbi:hypothetical protein FIBSPDRAFT_461781 [Athelia psychrophila]|uniref:DUF5745 domain-containing protein n=1 Tax=Athelia psychrophila TaxID=1759441 RepID=A0A167VGY7_9AGAM|nr:hypothetical protein FIBSPDRAFT_370285 [Fibularhizoctonia sp. CBS 109695]KZP23376.1 hypothetical protein FIBSPDRAFT_461781 [Fibularhizoctonia sp. CBS 109695]